MNGKWTEEGGKLVCGVVSGTEQVVGAYKDSDDLEELKKRVDKLKDSVTALHGFIDGNTLKRKRITPNTLSTGLLEQRQEAREELQADGEDSEDDSDYIEEEDDQGNITRQLLVSDDDSDYIEEEDDQGNITRQLLVSDDDSDEDEDDDITRQLLVSDDDDDYPQDSDQHFIANSPQLLFNHPTPITTLEHTQLNHPPLFNRNTLESQEIARQGVNDDYHIHKKDKQVLQLNKRRRQHLSRLRNAQNRKNDAPFRPNVLEIPNKINLTLRNPLATKYTIDEDIEDIPEDEQPESPLQQLLPRGHSEIDPETLLLYDEVFFGLVARVCCDAHIRDLETNKPIHQTKVAGKLQKLPFSDFKQFKFNITPFTNLYRQELLATPSHLTDDEKSIKWVKNYLHHHRYVCRYSDKGVPLKSKGTLVWVVEAKKTEDGGWIFKEFERKFQPEPEAKAMVGGLWEWKPRIMDPRNKPIENAINWRESRLPSWLSWNRGTLSGVPERADIDGGGEVLVVAKFKVGGVEEILEKNFTIEVSI